MALIGFNVPDGFKKQVERKAKNEGLTVSAYCIRCLKRDMEVEDRYLTYTEILELIDARLIAFQPTLNLDKHPVVSQEPIAGGGKLKTALKLIYDELLNGREPTVAEISSKVGMDVRHFGFLMNQTYNIESKNVRREGKKARRYLFEQKNEIGRILTG